MCNLSKLRKNSSLSISELAKQINVTSACVCQWEKGKRLPSITEVPKLARVLNCTIEEIVLCFCNE